MRHRLLPAVASLALALPVLATPSNGDIRETAVGLEVWSSQAATWIAPQAFFDAEVARLGGPTYGHTADYPPYASVREWQTLVDVAPDGRACPMVFFHQRWRRLPDVLALDDRLRNWDGCRDVFQR